MLTDHEFMRYSRQVLLDDIDVQGQEKLKNSKVLIVGLGGLGSPVSLYLAGAGVGNLWIADYDNLHLSNLQRQILYDTKNISKSKVELAANRLYELNPLININILHQKLFFESLLSIAKKVDLIVDCSDNMITRHDINSVCVMTKTTLVSGSAIGFSGQLIILEPPFNYGCYACLYPNKDDIELNCRMSGILGPVVGIIGSLQALETIKLLIGFPSVLSGKIFLFDAKQQKWNKLQLSISFKCPVCQEKNERNN
ncbi:HesA/MoeB/ThiF family protein [Candidatus Providencia siddallii]|uniref:Sulfur carrier protein ThiS adenylyltransferase n=1 Tax=Candidatus Providencia siddallii TaxID=1715285 RepID=A0ABM9NNK0_9GAMM